MFPGFPEETVRFFLDLRFHNETSWFHAHREAYEAYVRKPFSQFIQAMTPTVMRIADDMETRPNKCLARINRDIRFTRDKSPYRDHMWLLFRRSGEEREHSVMYWCELSPEVVEWGVGFWGYNRPAMDALRQRMEKKPAEVRRALRQCGIPDETLHIYGDRYKSMKPQACLPIWPCSIPARRFMSSELAFRWRRATGRRSSTGFRRTFCASGLSICCFGRPRMRAWQSWMHSGSEGE